MTDNDFRIEDRKERETKRPNYPLRRVKFLLAVIGLVASVTLMLTWHGGSLAGALVVEGVYLRHRVVADRQIRTQIRRKGRQSCLAEPTASNST